MSRFLLLAVVALSLASPPAQTAEVTPPPSVTAYDGLMYAEMGPLVQALERRGDVVTRLWHDAQHTDLACPAYIIGHSMGGNAAIRQAIKCQAEGHAPRAIIVIDAGRSPLADRIPSNAKFTCLSLYNPLHPIGGQAIYPDGTKLGQCHNVIVSGYSHLQMPSAPGIVRAVLNAIPRGSP